MAESQNFVSRKHHCWNFHVIHNGACQTFPSDFSNKGIRYEFRFESVTMMEERGFISVSKYSEGEYRPYRIDSEELKQAIWNYLPLASISAYHNVITITNPA
jgi:hypothetical protein